jgi:acyl-CoA synthetase (AMP-forming)/AMP-acid ligase II
LHPRVHASEAPERPAAILAETGEALTYGELEHRANQGAQLFRSLGIRSGEAIAIWLPNQLEYYEVYWAAQRAGLYIAPIPTAMTADEADYILADSGAKLLVTSGDVRAAAEIVAAPPPGLATILSAGAPVPGCKTWAERIADCPTEPIADESAGFHLVYSSGTTGRPKGIRLPLSGGSATDPHMLSDRLARRYAVGPDTVFLSPAPLYHTAPLAYTTMLQRLGASIVIMRKFDPEAALAAIARYRVTFAQMVPTMFIRLLRLPDSVRRAHDLSSLTHLVHAAAPCPVDVKRAMIEWLGPIIYEYYGGSEGNGSTFITPSEWLRKPGSVGRADWGTIHICDEAGDELPSGQDGIVYFEGGWDFRYHNDEAKTRESRNPKQPTWSTLGDIGHLDSDGYLYLTDRKSFMIISGGVNIYPQEIENLLQGHPLVADVAVIGVPNPDMGEEVKALIQPIDMASVSPEHATEIVNWCRARLSHIKCPRSVEFVAELPRTETGKLMKRLLRDMYWPEKAAG